MKYETSLKFIESGLTFDGESDLSLKELFHVGTSIIRAARRHSYRVRFVVTDHLTGEQLLVFYCRYNNLRDHYVCRLSGICKYGRATNGMTF